MKNLLIVIFGVILLVGCSYPEERANVLFVKAQKELSQAQTQEPAQALKSVEAARRDLDKIINKFPSSSLAVKLASGQSVGHISMASIVDEQVRLETHLETIACLANPSIRCVLDLALVTAKGIEDAYGRDLALMRIAPAQAGAGQLNQALEMAKAIEDPIYRAMALNPIIGAQAEAGQFKQALEAAKAIADADDRADAVRYIVTAQAKVGQSKHWQWRRV
jgi:hypothetical protein